MKNSIIIMGPVCVGKTTLSRAVAETTGLKLLPLDLIQWYYYAKMNMDLSLYSRLRVSKNIKAFLYFLDNYKKRFVEKVFDEFDNCVFDFGAMHSFFVYEDNIKWFNQIVKNSNCYLLLPDDNFKICLLTLNHRIELRYNYKEQMQFPKQLNEFYFSKIDSSLFGSKIIFQNISSDKEALETIITDSKGRINKQSTDNAAANKSIAASGA